jgi:hypothetical protein
MHNALRHGHAGFARSLFVNHGVRALTFAAFMVHQNDPALLLLSLSIVGDVDLTWLCRCTARTVSIDCLQALLEYGAPLVPNCWLYAAEFNRLGTLEVALRHGKESERGSQRCRPPGADAMQPRKGWCPTLPGVAASAGNVQFLMRIFEAGCPVWASARDGTPCKFTCRAFIPPGEQESVLLEDWTLVVSPDLVRSGPVLLYAAEIGAPLTARMEGMLGEVRDRALALAGCFRVAARLGREPGQHARTWAAMGQVPLEIIQDIATLAKISIVVRKLVA